MNYESFYTVSHELETKNSSLSIWANKKPNPIKLSQIIPKEFIRSDIKNVPGAFHLLNLFSQEECKRFIELTEKLGYQRKSETSLPSNILSK